MLPRIAHHIFFCYIGIHKKFKTLRFNQSMEHPKYHNSNHGSSATPPSSQKPSDFIPLPAFLSRDRHSRVKGKPIILKGQLQDSSHVPPVAAPGVAVPELEKYIFMQAATSASRSATKNSTKMHHHVSPSQPSTSASSPSSHYHSPPTHHHYSSQVQHHHHHHTMTTTPMIDHIGVASPHSGTSPKVLPILPIAAAPTHQTKAMYSNYSVSNT